METDKELESRIDNIPFGNHRRILLMSRKHDVNKEIENEVYCGTLPVLPKERKYGFMDALLVLSGYCIATWYSQDTASQLGVTLRVHTLQLS